MKEKSLAVLVVCLFVSLMVRSIPCAIAAPEQSLTAKPVEPSRPSMGSLSQALRNGDPKIVETTLDTIAKIGREASPTIPAMIELLEDQNTSPLLREKTEATLRIVSVGNARFVLSGSSTSSPEARDALVRVLVDLATKSTVDRDYMAMASMQDNVKSRELVARAFAQMTKMESPPDQVIRSLIVLRQDKNQTVRTIAADSLAKNIGPKSSHYSQVKAALAAPVESEVSVAKSTKLPVPGAPLAQPPAAVAEEAGD